MLWLQSSEGEIVAERLEIILESRVDKTLG